MIALAIWGGKALFQHIKEGFNFWRMLPLVIVGMLLCGGIAEAGVFDAAAIRPPWWDAIGWIILFLTMLIVG